MTQEPQPSVRSDEATLPQVLNLLRVSDADGHVIGVDLSGSKLGGTVEDAILLIPDSMGATGSTILRAVRHYIEHHGTPAKIIAMPMIVTAEYLHAVLQEIDGIQIYAGRLDRGLSTEDVLESTPGTHWDRERGLNENGCIVPGAGGMGEVLNNSWC